MKHQFIILANRQGIALPFCDIHTYSLDITRTDGGAWFRQAVRFCIAFRISAPWQEKMLGKRR